MARSSLALLVAAALAVVGCGTTTRTEVKQPLPYKGNYVSVRACPETERPRCFAILAVPTSPAARSYTYPSTVRKVKVAKPGTPEPQLTPGEGCCGITAKQIDMAYSIPKAEGEVKTTEEGQTIGIYENWQPMWADHDLKIYSQEMGLPQCTVASGCLKEVSTTGGELPRPRNAAEGTEALEGKLGIGAWERANKAVKNAVEAEMDAEVAHAICWYCKILYFVGYTLQPFVGETPFGEWAKKMKELGSTVESWSYGENEHFGYETTTKGREEAKAHIEEANSKFSAVGVPVVAANGDELYERHGGSCKPWETGAIKEGCPIFPSSFQGVIAAAGTYLTVEESGKRIAEVPWITTRKPEVVNQGTGGGCSLLSSFAWQSEVSGCNAKQREVADLAATGSPNSAVSAYTRGTGWAKIGGTSMSSPILAAMFAVGGGGHGVTYPAETVYAKAKAHPEDFFDINKGTNTSCTAGVGVAECSNETESAETFCKKAQLCLAKEGYDGVDGWGVPIGVTGLK